MKKLSFYVTALVAGVLASCSNVEDIQTSPNEMEDFVAVMAEGGARTALDGDGKSVLWSADDGLAIFRKNSYNTQYKLSSGVDTKNGTFKYTGTYTGDGTVTGIDKNYAVYPYDGNSTINANKAVSVTIPSTQTYTEGTFDSKAAFMFAGSDNTTLNFMNAHALLKIALTKMPGDDDYSIKSIKMTSSTEPLNGAATIQMDNDAPKVTISEEGDKELTLNCESGVTVSSLDANNPAVFYLVVTPGTYAGLKLTLTGANNYNKELTLPAEALTIERNKIVTIQYTCGSDDFTGGIPDMESTNNNVNP